MQTTTQTAPEVKPALNAIASCTQTAAAFVMLANLLARPEFAGFDELTTEIISNGLIQLFPRDIPSGTRETTRRALAIAKIVPGEWTRTEDGQWLCQMSGALAEFKIIIHYAEPARTSVVKPANVIDIAATEKALAA